VCTVRARTHVHTVQHIRAHTHPHPQARSVRTEETRTSLTHTHTHTHTRRSQEEKTRAMQEERGVILVAACVVRRPATRNAREDTGHSGVVVKIILVMVSVSHLQFRFWQVCAVLDHFQPSVTAP
jgi:hypothetical protein